MIVIYKVVNLINDKIYVGQQCRYTTDYLGSGILIIAAIKKYGILNFKKEILEILSENSTIQLMNERETYWIKKLNATDKNIGYNILAEGGSSKGYKHTEENKKKLSERTKGNGNGMYRKSNYSVWLKKYGKEEADKRLKLLYEKVSKAKMGKKLGYPSPLIGFKHTEETKAKLRKNHPHLSGENHPTFGYKHTEETRKKLSEYRKNDVGEKNHFYGKTHSLETKNKISESRKNKHSGKNHFTYKEIPINQYDKNGNFIKRWNSIYELEEAGFDKRTLLRCVRGRNKSSQNYIWKYEN